MDKNFTVRAYHVTSLENAESILRTGFVPSRNLYDWLGEGIYFFQEAPNFAYHWGSRDRKRGLHDDVAILAADIQLTGFIDLLDFKWGDLLRETYSILESKSDKEFLKAKVSQKPYVPGSSARLGHWLDRYVIEAAVGIMALKSKEVLGIRSGFLEGQELYEKSHIMDRQHIQIAVRSMSAIKTYWQEDPPITW